MTDKRKCGHEDWCDCERPQKYPMPKYDPYTGEPNPLLESSQLYELNKFLIALANMDKVGIRRKILALEDYIHNLKQGTIKNSGS